ncbi:MAG: FxsA family protein [Magnetococcus sp. DMHC-6]
MLRLIALLFLPFLTLEIWLLIQVGGIIGGVPTLLELILSAVFGFHLIRHQGMKSIIATINKLNQGESATHELGEVGLVLVAGTLLILPGILTDACGLLLAWPWLQRLLAPLIFNNDTPCSPEIIEGVFTVDPAQDQDQNQNHHPRLLK